MMMKRQIIGAALLCAVSFPAAQAQVRRTVSVDELFSLLETNNRTLTAKKTGVDAAAHAVSEAKSQRLPDIGVSVSASYNGNVLMTDRNFSNARGFSSPHFGNSFALEAEQVVYAGGAVNAGIRLAELQKQQAENGVVMSRSQLRFTVLGQYLDLLKLANSIRVYEHNIALTEKLIEDIKAKHANGLALRNDITRYELQMQTLRLGLRKLHDSRAVMNHQMCNSIGICTDVEIVPDTNAVNLPVSNDGEEFWQGRAAEASPMLAQTALGVKTAEQQLRIARSEMMPKVAVVAADNFSGPFTYDIPPIDKNINIWYVGVGVRYSLSSLFKSNKAVRRAKAELRQSSETHAATAETVDNQVQEAYTLYRQSFEDLRTRQKSVQLAAQNYQVITDRYLNQMSLITDMIDASNVKIDAELQEVDARISTVYAYYRMKYVAGDI